MVLAWFPGVREILKPLAIEINYLWFSGSKFVCLDTIKAVKILLFFESIIH